MEYPEMITRLPQADVPYPNIEAYMMRSEHGLTVFFHFTHDTIVPPHSHGAQWGTVLEGEFEFTIGEQVNHFKAGDSYAIPAGVIHSAKIPAGVKLIDVFEEPDRFKAKP